MPYETIATEIRDRILTITLNRPDRLNAFNSTMRDELLAVLDEADAARERIASARASSRRRRGCRPRDAARTRDRMAWEAARSEVEQAEQAGADSRGSAPPPACNP